MYIPEYPIANSCSGFSPFPVPPSAFGVARLSLRPFDSTWPLRPAPVAVPVTVYCNCVKHCIVSRYFRVRTLTSFKVTTVRADGTRLKGVLGTVKVLKDDAKRVRVAGVNMVV